MTRVLVDAEALNNLLAAVESDSRKFHLVMAVRASVRAEPVDAISTQEVRETLVQNIRSRSK